MFALSWLAIFLASLATWWTAHRRWAYGLLLLGYGAALVNGQLGIEAAVPIGVLLIAASAVRPERGKLIRYGGHVAFVVVAVALSLHLLPGFHNPRVIGPLRFTTDAVPFTMYLNLDKPLIGFWLVWTLAWVHPERDPRVWLRAGVIAMVATATLCLATAYGIGMVAWAPKAPELSWLWLINNLLLVSFAEEALFRGYLQGGLCRLLHGRRYGDTLAIAVAAILFGLAHVSGGGTWAVLAGVAGAGYGLAYRAGGLRAAVLAHVGLNAAHFFLFTYPSLDPAVHG